MLEAIHLKTNTLIGAYKLLTDLEWVGKQKEEFIAPLYRIGNPQDVGERDVKVIFINKSVDGKQPHFRIKDSVALDISNYESPEHVRIKESIYQLILENKLFISYADRTLKIGDLNIDDVLIEGRVDYQRNSKIADVLIKLKQRDKILGEGIAIEIQLSPQSYNTTSQRSYERASKGYSCTWLFREDYEDFTKKPLLKVIPFNEAINNYFEDKSSKMISTWNQIGKDINNKISQMQGLIESFDYRKRILMDESSNLINLQKNFKQKLLAELNEKLFKEIKEDLEIQTTITKNKVVEDTSLKIGEVIKSSFGMEKIISNLEEKSEKLLKQNIDKILEEHQKKIEEKINSSIKEKVELKELHVWNEEIKEKISKEYFKVSNMFQAHCRKLESFIENDLERANFWENKLKELIKKNGCQEQSNLC